MMPATNLKPFPGNDRFKPPRRVGAAARRQGSKAADITITRPTRRSCSWPFRAAPAAAAAVALETQLLSANAWARRHLLLPAHLVWPPRPRRHPEQAAGRLLAAHRQHRSRWRRRAAVLSLAQVEAKARAVATPLLPPRRRRRHGARGTNAAEAPAAQAATRVPSITPPLPSQMSHAEGPSARASRSSRTLRAARAAPTRTPSGADAPSSGRHSTTKWTAISADAEASAGAARRSVSAPTYPSSA